MFDSILESVASRFGITLDKARQLLGMLIAIIFNDRRGGPAGFVDLFRSRGLGSMVDSWIGHGPNEAVTAAQLDNVLGSSILASMAHKAGLDQGTTGNVLAALLPDVFNTLSEDGRVPGATLPDRLRGYLDGLGDWLQGLGGSVLGLGAAAAGTVGSAAHAAGRGVGRAADGVVDTAGDVGRATARAVDRADGRRDGKMGILPWLLLAAALVAAFFLLRGCKKPEPAAVVPPAATAPAEPAAAAVPSAAPTFAFENVDGSKVTVHGALASEAEKTRLWNALKAAFGDGNVNGDIVINPNTAPAGWLDRLIALLPDLKAKGVKFNFDGDRLKLDTSGMSEADRFALTDKFRTAFRDGQYEITGLWDRAMAALAALKPGYSGGDLVKALNLMNVYFATGSANITSDSLETLQAAANAIKGAPAGTRIEAGGHTDNVGDAASNMTLSQQRADAVVAKLGELGVASGILSAKGYGQDKPIADNATEAGKAKNRRMEFTVLK